MRRLLSEQCAAIYELKCQTSGPKRHIESNEEMRNRGNAYESCAMTLRVLVTGGTGYVSRTVSCLLSVCIWIYILYTV